MSTLPDYDKEMEVDRTIDVNVLDVECAQQADLFYKWAQRDITAKRDVERTSFDVEVLESRLQLRAREHPEDFKLGDKVTEAAIRAAVQSSDKYIKAKESLFAAKEFADKMSKAVMAMDMKKRMLEALITLHGQQYFAGPEVPHNLLEVWQKHQQQRTSAVNDKQSAKARKRVKLPED